MTAAWKPTAEFWAQPPRPTCAPHDHDWREIDLGRNVCIKCQLIQTRFLASRAEIAEQFPGAKIPGDEP